LPCSLFAASLLLGCPPYFEAVASCRERLGVGPAHRFQRTAAVLAPQFGDGLAGAVRFEGGTAGAISADEKGEHGS